MEVPAALKPLAELWGRLNTRQRIAIGVAAAATLAFMGGLIYLGSQQEYSVLFSDLRNTDAQAIVEKLKTANVPYRLSSGGTAISVPTDRVAEMRLQVAASGILSGGHVGFDLFDRSGFGVTDFTQKVNYQRALEGELARTLEDMDEVENARVHVTAPRDSVFIDKTEPAKASVVLRLRSGRELSRERTEAVVSLLSSAVEGLDPRDVSVMDTRGRVFASPDRDGNQTNNGATPIDANLEVRRKFEAETAARIVELLEPVVGEGKVRANVAADVDFSQVEETAEKYDPQSAVIRSKQSLQESRASGARGPGGLVGARANDPQLQPTPTPPPQPAAGANEQPAASPTPLPAPLGDQRLAETTNYEIDKVVTRTLHGGGKVAKVSASVVVDFKQENGTPVTRTDDELKKMQALVSAAIGMDAQRGDQVVVQSLPFDTPADARPSWLEKYRDLILLGLKYGAIVLAALLLIFFAVRPAQRALREALKPAMPEAQLLTANAGASVSVGEALSQQDEQTAGNEMNHLTEGERRQAAGALADGTVGAEDNARTVAEMQAALAAELAAELDASPVAEVVRTAEIKKLLVERSKKNPESIAATIRTWLEERN